MILGGTSRVATRQLKRPCVLCDLPVVRGDRYEQAAVVFDGRIGSQVSHTVCVEEVGRLSDLDRAFWELVAFELENGAQGRVLGDYYENTDLSESWRAWRAQR